MISAYDRFFGGPESVGFGRLVTGRDGSGLLPVEDVGSGLLLAEDVVRALLALPPDALGFPFRLLLSVTDCGLGGCLSVEPPSDRAAGRGDGFGELPSALDCFSASESTRATLPPPERISSSAFRLGNGAVGRDAGFGDTGGFSPVIDAIKSRI